LCFPPFFRFFILPSCTFVVLSSLYLLSLSLSLSSSFSPHTHTHTHTHTHSVIGERECSSSSSTGSSTPLSQSSISWASSPIRPWSRSLGANYSHFLSSFIRITLFFSISISD